MTTKLNAQALANTARSCASMANSVSGTIKSIVIHWNLCCQQSKLEGFTTEARYTRRAALAADMLRMAEQLDNMAEGKDALTGKEIEAQRAAGYPVDEEGNDTREWCGNDVVAAHAEALVINSGLEAGIIPVMIDTRPMSEVSKKLYSFSSNK